MCTCYNTNVGGDLNHSFPEEILCSTSKVITLPSNKLLVVHFHTPKSEGSKLRVIGEGHALAGVPCGVLLAGTPWRTQHPLLHTLMAMIMHYLQMFVLLALLLLVASLVCVLISLLQKDKLDSFWPVKQISDPITSRSGLYLRDQLINAILRALEPCFPFPNYICHYCTLFLWIGRMGGPG